MFQVYEKHGRPIEFSDSAVFEVEQFIRELADYCHINSEASATAICSLKDNDDGTTKFQFGESIGVDADVFFSIANPATLVEHVDTCVRERAESYLLYYPDSRTVRPWANQAEVGSQSAKQIIWIRPLSADRVAVSICPITSERSTCMAVINNAHLSRDSRQEFEQAKRATEQAKIQNNDNREVIRFATALSGSLPLEEQAYQQANEIKQFIGCDRVTVFEVNNAAAKVLAVSGQPRFNRRSNSIRAAQDMVGSITRTGETFEFLGNFDELADSLTNRIRRYTDESLVNSFMVFPLIKTVSPVYASDEEMMQEAISPGSASKRETIGVVLVEQIEDVIEPGSTQERWNQIRPLVVNQFNNSRRYDSIFLIRAWTMLGRFAALYRGQTKRKAIAITSIIGLLLLAALIIPADFKIRCEGHLVFDNTAELYTKGDGNVVQLNALDGKSVSKGDVLLVQQNLKLEGEYLKVAGRASQLQTEIDDLNDLRVQSALSPVSEEDDTADSAAQQVRQLEVELAQLTRQQLLMESELANLKIVAPFDGTIAGWKTERRLLDRPLEKGTHLFSVIPADAQFKLELRVPDQRAGYVQNAWLKSQSESEEVPVVFRLASAPGSNRDAIVEFVSPGLERDEQLGYALPIRAIANSEIPLAERKSKTAVMAQVICGKHSFAYCKTYEAIDWVKAKLFEATY